MKHFLTFTILTIVALIITACGGKAVPTVNPVDIQNTAVAAASTMVAQTQAAVPTPTLPPPTEIPTQTPLPTDTPVQLPTLQVLASPTTAAVSGNNTSGDPCATRVLSGDLKGKPTRIRIANTLKVPITVSIYLNETASHGECGYRSYSLSKGADVVIDDLIQGCYNLWAWSDAQGNKFNSSGYGCINNPDKWTFEVNTATIKFIGP